MTIRLTSGPARATGTRIVEPVAGGARLTLRAEGRSGLFFALAEPVVDWWIRRLLRTALANVKRSVEAAP